MALAMLTALLASLAGLAFLLFIFLGIFCHVYSSIYCRTRFGAPLRGFCWHLYTWLPLPRAWLRAIFICQKQRKIRPMEKGALTLLRPRRFQHLTLFNHRSLRQQRRRICHQRGVNAPARVRLPPRLILKQSRDPERRWPHFDRNHSSVAGSSTTIDEALRKKLSTSASLPGFVSTRASNANFISAILLLLDC
jgi:hypothetical protein